MRFGVYETTNGRPEGTPYKVFTDREEAKDYAKRMRAQLSVGEKTYYKISYKTIPIK